MYGESLYEGIKPFSEKIASVAEEGSNTCIMTNLDADGLISASIISMALLRQGGRSVIRCTSDMFPADIEHIKSEAYDFYVISDLGVSLSGMLNDVLGDKWMIIDHHQPKTELTGRRAERILNSFEYGINGELEISSGGLAYILATQIEKRNWDLSGIAVVSAISDRQDKGDKRSLLGINSEIIKTAESHGLISVNLDLMFSGRETKPIHEALASTSFPYIEGLTWNMENAYAIIKNSGVRMMEDGRWRVLADIKEEEKRIVLDAVVKFASTSSKYPKEDLTEYLVGYTYTLVEEDLRSQLRDAREFSNLLNACARSGKAGVGIGICMGDRDVLLTEGEQIVESHREILSKCVYKIHIEKWRTIDDGQSIFVNAENVLSEEMLEAASALLCASPAYDRVLFIWTAVRNNMIKFSCKKFLCCKSVLHLGLIVRSCAESVGGTGDGHKESAVCRIPSDRLGEFASKIRGAVLDFNSVNSA